MPPVITPPIRTSLLTANGEPFSSVQDGAIQTTREWWMYWRKLGDQINQNAKLVSEGPHASRPIAESMPDGALYVESDRNVIYQNQGGEWQYIAGTTPPFSRLMAVKYVKFLCSSLQAHKSL